MVLPLAYSQRIGSAVRGNSFTPLTTVGSIGFASDAFFSGSVDESLVPIMVCIACSVSLRLMFMESFVSLRSANIPAVSSTPISSPPMANRNDRLMSMSAPFAVSFIVVVVAHAMHHGCHHEEAEEEKQQECAGAHKFAQDKQGREANAHYYQVVFTVVHYIPSIFILELSMPSMFCIMLWLLPSVCMPIISIMPLLCRLTAVVATMIVIRLPVSRPMIPYSTASLLIFIPYPPLLLNFLHFYQFPLSCF